MLSRVSSWLVSGSWLRLGGGKLLFCRHRRVNARLAASELRPATNLLFALETSHITLFITVLGLLNFKDTVYGDRI